MAENLDVDVAVVGAGPAGIAAAVRAAEAGRRVVVVDEAARPGGQIWRHQAHAPLPRLARRWLARLERSSARVIGAATVFDAVGGGTVSDPPASGTISGGPVGARVDPEPAPRVRLAVEREGSCIVIRTSALVLATGARERFLPFPGWTLPGVLGIGAMQALLKSGADVRGKRVVVAGSGPLLLPVAASLVHAGATVLRVSEQAPLARVAAFAAGLWRTPARLLQAGGYRRAFAHTPYRTGEWVVRVDGDGERPAAADVLGLPGASDAGRLTRDNDHGGLRRDEGAAALRVTISDGTRARTERCHLLCVGFGLVPSTELARLLGCSTEGEAVAIDRTQATSVPAVWCAGEPTGIGGADAALLEGQIAGLAAAGAPVPAALWRASRAQRRFAGRLAAAFALRDELRALPDDATVVCRCEDVSFGRLRAEPATRAAKLRTRAGMGACQARVCGPALRFLLGWEPDTIRPPVLPASIAALRDFDSEEASR